MFSASATDGAANGPSVGAATRSRRRQRPQSQENSAQQPKAKRQRPNLAEQTVVDPDATAENYEVKAARPQVAELKQDGLENTPFMRKELSFRSKKAKTGERVSKGDGTVVLVRW